MSPPSSDIKRGMLCVPQLLFALALVPYSPVLSVCFVLDAFVVLAPWRVPRFSRSATSYWAETLLTVLPMAVAMAYTIIRGDVPFSTDYLAIQIIVGVALGAVGLYLSGLPLNSVFNGDIAQLMGPDKKSHIKARTFQTSAAPLLEEYTYRVAPLIYGNIALAAVAQIVFVLRHYLLRGGNDLRINRAFYTRLSLSAIYLLSYILTGSILPAVLAHYIHNAPTLYLEYQRHTISGGPQDAK